MWCMYGAISRYHLDSGDCQEFFLLIVPADEDLVSLNFGQDDALHMYTLQWEREMCSAPAQARALYPSILHAGNLSLCQGEGWWSYSRWNAMGNRINKAHLSKLQLSQSHVLLYFLKTSSFFEKKEKFFLSILETTNHDFNILLE